MRSKNWAICLEPDCNSIVKSRGWCKYHYQKLYKSSPEYNPASGDKRRHPLYSMWHERKVGNLLCNEWLDFWIFVKDVGDKPKNYFLVRIKNEPFGPNNFKWQEPLKRKVGESVKDWYARKWAARQALNPGLERNRYFKRHYGITSKDYDDKLKEQEFKCKICNEPETAVDARVGTIKRLALDHCHETGKLRDLLCWRCNSILGKVSDSVELLELMKQYLLKHRKT